ncbi:hypothetical protein [Saccharopolyspora spinosa]|uniref:Transposase n=1 Tax=Saccharopolyspora spinosa TaxID=60894 RepID=A0A2N3Y743_SACSN|nr:hypothetical protein [Saccharopolyspora spinosa]PKW18685.1 transposase [Saccharopolyspora spinosa]
MSRSKKHPPELRKRAVPMFAEARGKCAPERSAMQAVADLPGAGTAETLRRWVRQSEIDTRTRARVASEESAELQRPRRKNVEPGRDNATLKAASAFFAAGIDRPHR